jgi:hypothetical protein
MNNKQVLKNLRIYLETYSCINWLNIFFSSPLCKTVCLNVYKWKEITNVHVTERWVTDIPFCLVTIKGELGETGSSAVLYLVICPLWGISFFLYLFSYSYLNTSRGGAALRNCPHQFWKFHLRFLLRGFSRSGAASNWNKRLDINFYLHIPCLGNTKHSVGIILIVQGELSKSSELNKSCYSKHF